uniref:NADH-ubiquinone oxidoreductase chain 4 n=1 Tax=Nemertopsis tetraclitophila TaxID=1417004 RepID=A0A075CJF4_9BILA|nr:NADH dehydrogenase subunit 4 [Nemertopsis tetraclitophila]AGZ63910.1 NADH dehydrogenase subunit 4 [Nemertopsis tetraclitophila]
MNVSFGFFFFFIFTFLFVVSISMSKNIMLFFFFFFFFFFFDYGWSVYNGVFFLDSTSILMVSLSFFITYLMYLSSMRLYITDYFSSYFNFFLLFLCFVLIICFFSINFFFFFFFFEASLVPTLMIILGWGYQPERMQAGFYLFMYTIFFLFLFCLFFFFVVLILSVCGLWALDLIFFFLLDSFLFFFVFLISVLAFMVKLPVFGLHLWLPKAHVEAPVSGSMILAGVLLKLGGYGLFRVFSMYEYCFPDFFFFFVFFFLWGGVLTSLVCLRQTDLKGLVAYSSVGHMAILFCGYFCGVFLGVSGSLMMMVGHGLCSSCLFVLASLGYDLLGTRSIFLVKGSLVFMPSFCLWWFLFCSGNMAAPSSLNLCSEIFLFMGLLGLSFYFFFFLGFLSFFVGAYSLYLFMSFNHGSLSEGSGYFYMNFVSFFLVCFMHLMPLYFCFLFCDIFIV